MRKRKNKERASQEYILENATADQKTGCWVWQRSLMSNGYGAAWNGTIVTGAHRIAYELWTGPIPAGAFVLHRCDNRKCCNPSHLFLGSPKDNTQDMMQKGRHVYGLTPRGVNHPRAKFTQADIDRILTSQEPSRKQARQYQVSKTTILNLRKGATYATVDRA